MNGKLVFFFALSVFSFGSISSLASSGQVVVRSRASIPISLGTLSKEAIGTQTIEIVNAALVSLALDTSKFIVPAVSNAPLDFGSLGFASLFDNNLNVCGEEHNLHCNTGTIRIYTTGA